MVTEKGATTPDVVRRYLEAHDRRDTEVALSAFAPGAHVLDDGKEYSGRHAIRDWLGRASTQFTYTRTFLDAHAEAPNVWIVRNRLEGNFPGGVSTSSTDSRLSTGASLTSRSCPELHFWIYGRAIRLPDL